MRPLPLIDPRPPRLSRHGQALERLEASGVFTNNGPEVQALEREATERFFDGRGATLAVASATAGLAIAIREAAGRRVPAHALALMPAFTFAATAHAAQWAGLTPILCDADPDNWSACPKAEERLLAAHGDRIRVIVPYATFGDAIDLERYLWLGRRHGAGVVVDAAASLGTLDGAGRGFGAGAPFAMVFSMHATKPFAVAEGGLVHSGDRDLIGRLRAMAGFGFEAGRTATLPGTNAKLPELLALAARLKLKDADAVAEHRAELEAAYREALAGHALQRVSGRRRAVGFLPVLLPAHAARARDAVAAALAADGIGTGRYFSPHLGEQPWFRDTTVAEPTPVADDLSARMMSLPVTDAMTADDARRAAAAFVRAVRAPAAVAARPRDPAPAVASAVIVGGGPAGTALLTAASRAGRLEMLARDGLVVVERDRALGGGRLGGYAITSDSTAQTFLTAVRGNPCPEIAALADGPAAAAVDAHADSLGVPLATAGPLLAATGRVLGELMSQAGGTVLSGHEALGARRVGGGLWSVRLRRLSDGTEAEQPTRALVIATGGHQPLDRLAMMEVAGARLLDLAADRLVRSDEVLRIGGLEQAADILSRSPDPRVAVIGGSTSALATVSLLLKARPAIPFGAGGVTLLHRRPLRPFFPSADAARAEGFHDFGPDDVCPVSGFVYRLGGFRLEARELVLRMLAVGGRSPEPRVALHRIAGDDAAARALIGRADLVVAGTGYRPRALPLTGIDGEALRLDAHEGRPMVDRHCRVLAAGGRPLPGVYGIGLAAGFVPWGRLGGEPSFRGQANGLWMWQNDVGAMIADQLLGAAPEARAAA